MYLFDVYENMEIGKFKRQPNFTCDEIEVIVNSIENSKVRTTFSGNFFVHFP